MKIQRLNPGILIILLGIASFFSVLLLANLQELFRWEVSLWGSIISLVLVLVLCAISARTILWAYSRVQFPNHPGRIFIYGFVISAISVVISVGLTSLQEQYVWEQVKDQFENIPLKTGYTNYLSEGFEPVLVTCATVSIILLWMARGKKIKDGTAALLSSSHRKQDIVLILSTLVVYAFIMSIMLKFIMFTSVILGLGSGQ